MQNTNFENDSLNSTQPIKHSKLGARAMLVAIFIAIAGFGAIFLAPKFLDHPVKESNAELPATEALTQPVAPPNMAPADPELTAEEKAEEEARVQQIVLGPRVRETLCEDYGDRYLKARTGVDLVRAVQLSQAAGCGWEAILHADAATHELIPEALAVAQRMDADDVPTAGTVAADNAELINKLGHKIDDLDRKVDNLRYRIR